MTAPAASKLIRIAGNAGLIALGTGVGQLFVLATTPYLTRIYSPAEFGQLALLFTLSNITMAVGCLRYDLALPSCKETEKVPLFVLCGALGLSLGGMVFLAAHLPWGAWFSHPITQLLGSPWIMLLLVVGVAAYQLSMAYLIREGSFAWLAMLRASQGGLFSLAAAISIFGLLWSHVISFTAGGFLVAACILWQARHRLAQTNKAIIRRVAHSYRKFPGYALPGALLDVLGVSAGIWIISNSYGLANAGQYSQLQRLIGAPLTLGSMGLAQVMLKQTADELRAGQPIWPLVRNVGLALGTVAITIMVCLLLFGPMVLHLFLGPQWRVDRYFVCLVAGAVFVRTCVSPLSSALITMQRFRPAVIWQTCYFVSTYTILRWFSIRLGFDRFILVFFCHELIQYTIYLFIIRNASRNLPCAGFSA